MIEINFVPSELRKKKRGDFFAGKFNLPLEVVIGLGGGLIMLLIMTHVFLVFVNLTKLAQFKSLQQQTEIMKPSKDKADLVVNEYRQLQGSYKAIDDITGNRKGLWAQKLNILSELLPHGVWLKKISLKGDMLFIEGSAVSEKKKEMSNIHEFVGVLRKDKNFVDHLSELELGSIQRRRLNKTEIVDFVITAKYK